MLLYLHWRSTTCYCTFSVMLIGLVIELIGDQQHVIDFFYFSFFSMSIFIFLSINFSCELSSSPYDIFSYKMVKQQRC